jgi:lambda repressor-like predicted transcriptional regulator
MNYDEHRYKPPVKRLVEGVPLSEISKETGICLTTLHTRYSRGVRTLEEMSKPTQWKRNYEERLREATNRGKLILSKCNDIGLSIADLSKRSGVSSCAIDEFCYNPNSNIQARTLYKICLVLDLSMDYVMGVR